MLELFLHFKRIKVSYRINTCLVIISLAKYILHNAIGKNHTTIIYLQTQNLPSSHFRK